MVVLNHDDIVETGPVIDAAARADGVIFKRAKERRCLARVEDDETACCRVNESPRQRRDAGQSLQEVERGSLVRQQTLGVSLVLGNDRPRLAPRTVAVMYGDGDAGIELPERFGGDVETGDNAGRLGQNDRAGPLLGVDDALSGDIAPAEILRQRASNQLAVDPWIERLERD